MSPRRRPEPTTEVKCPACGAAPGLPCRRRGTRALMSKPHLERVKQ